MAEIANSWLKKPLGDVANVISGYAFKSSEFKEQGIPVIKIKNIRVGFVDLSDADRVDEKYLSIPDRFHVQRGDVLISLTGSHITQPNSVVGRVARHAADLPRCLLNQRAGKIIVKDRSRCDPSFLFYALSEQETLLAIAMKAHGAASQANVSPSQVESIEVPLPPLSVQQRIAGILSAYDELIENSQRRIKILESMARALYREWFVHFRFPGHENHPRAASPLGEIPQGWEVVSFERLLASMTGGDWGSEQPEDRDTAEVMVVRGTDFDGVAYGGPLRAPVRYIKPSSLVSRGLKVGDVVIENSINAKSRSVGTTLLMDNHVLNRLGRDAIAASFCKVCRLHDPRLAPLVHLRARHLREDARMEYYQNVAANGIANFQAQKFAKEEYLVLPTDETMRAKLIEPIASLFHSVGILASQLANLRSTRDLLLPRLLSGQVEIAGSEI